MSSYFNDDENEYNNGESSVGSLVDSGSDSDSESIIVKSTMIGGEGEEEQMDEDEVDDDDDESDDDDDDDDDGDYMEGGADLEEGEIDEEEEEREQKAKKIKKIPSKVAYKKSILEDENSDDDDEDGEQYLQKFDNSLNENYINNYHPESILQNYDEILSMVKVIRDKNGIIIDDLHKTIPYLTKYERARILGQRAKQINAGAPTFVKVPENVIDGYIIAELELKAKRIPFIIRRPLPNGGSEYWNVKDLEDITF
jgi:DNA-directed RNA polymerase I, II, and III subunit RPABC2